MAYETENRERKNIKEPAEAFFQPGQKNSGVDRNHYSADLICCYLYRSDLQFSVCQWAVSCQSDTDLCDPGSHLCDSMAAPGAEERVEDYFPFRFHSCSQ